ncbi:helix-turn-helix domain-containing protein [Desulfurivibrio sp. C05AmB]|uniref:helix-turn-helix domain-containing protein n=1 Tax=Desulfurivibrio sp. C05AmB TaxID=3374371 RepID=UPI00376F04B5
MSKLIITSTEIGAAIRRRRKTLGLTQEKLAEKVGVSYQQVQRYENGTTTLNVENMQRIAHALGVPPASFFMSEDLPVLAKNSVPVLSTEERNLLSLFKKIPTSADKKLVTSITRRLTKKNLPK